MTPAEYGRQLAAAEPPLSDWQIEYGARILAQVPSTEERAA